MKKFIISECVLNEIKDVFKRFINKGILDVEELELFDNLEEVKETKITYPNNICENH